MKEVNDMQPRRTPRKHASGDTPPPRSDPDELPAEVQDLDSQGSSRENAGEDRKSASNRKMLQPGK